MTFRQQQMVVFLGTMAVIFGLFTGGVYLIARRLTTEATMQTALLMARQVEIALADSLQARPQKPGAPSQGSPWSFLGLLFPGQPASKSSAPSRGPEVKGLMRAYLDRSGSIEAMWVLNAEGKILYASLGREEGKSIDDAAMRENLHSGISTIVIRQDPKGQYYDVLVPLQMPKGVKGPGALRLWINPGDWTELIAGMGRQLTLLFVLGGGVALCSAFLTTAIYTRRFRIIGETLRKAEAGTYESRPSYTARDEVGASLDLIDRLVMKQRGATGRAGPLQRVALAARTLAHEVKSPLNAMAVHLELLRQNTPATDSTIAPQAQQRSLETLETSVRQVDHLVRDFTEFGASVSLQAVPLDLAQVLEGSLEAVQAECSAKGIAVTKELHSRPWSLQGDATRLRQAFDNLLRNAMEAQPNGGWIKVTGYRNGARLALDFTDAGPGIPDEQRANLFDFGHSTKPGGSGIGLSLSQLIVEAHGGTLQCVDEDGSAGGATFRMTLPLAE